MSLKEEIEKMKRVQNFLLEYVKDDLNAEENYENFIKIIKDYKINADQNEFKLILRLINTIGNNHQRANNFTSKIERILLFFEYDILKHFRNFEIFQLFWNNKRILLFLLQEKILKIDEYIASLITSDDYIKLNYAEYFSPEIKEFLTDEFIQKHCDKNTKLKDENFIKKIKKEKNDKFYEKRKEGENDNFLCYLIRTNNAKEYGIYMNRQNMSFDISIEESIFETNQFLIEQNKISLNEYAAFFGSLEIIKYNEINEGIKATSSMWNYAIHSRNAELIQYLEDKKVSPSSSDRFETILKESIKCHHNDVSTYIINNLIEEEDLNYSIKNNFNDNLYYSAVRYDNYCFFPENIKYKNMLFYACMFDYFKIVKLYLEQGIVDINHENIKTL
ncbi:hypothetical protein M9Y10_008192 [Tritrichomonas musculus]|uniref:DUF3447 domain-containing protein n=1 Tax=Tritrichomonas musculus TaxID=1915356 RepID=A0ABR2IYK7_9EUKA